MLQPRRTVAAIAGDAIAGLCLAAAVTLIRWQSWRPYGAFMIPFDVVALVAGAVASGLLLRSAGRWLAGSPAVLPAVLVIWGAGVADASFSGAMKSGLAMSMLVATTWLLLRRGIAGRARVVPVIAAALLSAMVAASLAGWHATIGTFALVPAAIALLAALGIQTSRPRPLLSAVIATGAAALLVTCATIAPPGEFPRAPTAPSKQRASPAAPSVVLIVLDTLRRDHLSLYGYARKTTPQIDRWAGDALVFDQMTATSSWTLPSHASMFTGLFPRSHGAHGFRSTERHSNTYVLGPEPSTLAELASDAGIATGAVVANFHFLGPEFGVSRGFDSYWIGIPRKGYQLPLVDGLVRRAFRRRYDDQQLAYYPARSITDRAIDWVRERGDQRYFLFVNYLDVHRPNNAPPTPEVPLDDEEASPRLSPSWDAVLEGKPIDPRVRRGLENAYDRELIGLDRQVGRLLELLRAEGRDRNTCVIVTSDHGELFGEHGLVDHMITPYREAIDVPCIVTGPGIAAGRSSKPVQTVDVFSTIAELLGVDSGPRQGTSLLGEETHPIVSEWYACPDGALRNPRFKGRFDSDVQTLQSGTLFLMEFEDGRCELYDLATDPAETHNVATERPADVARLRAELDHWRATHPAAPRLQKRGELPDLSDENDSALQQLGYGR